MSFHRISQGHSLVWTVWDHSFLSYMLRPNKQTEKQTDIVGVGSYRWQSVWNAQRQWFAAARCRTRRWARRSHVAPASRTWRNDDAWRSRQWAAPHALRSPLLTTYTTDILPARVVRIELLLPEYSIEYLIEYSSILEYRLILDVTNLCKWQMTTDHRNSRVL